MLEILMCNHSNESYSAILFCGNVCYALDGGPVLEILMCDHSNESY